MAELNINKAVSSDMQNIVDSWEVSPLLTDGISEQEETEWQNPYWPQWLGYYKTIPELKNAIDIKALWTVGKGYETDVETGVILENIRGWGKDSFLSILMNMEVIKRINGDSYAEIIRAQDGTLINLKPLDAGTIKIIVNRQGIIKRYEQTAKIPTKHKGVKKFEPKNIFHLVNRNRVADEIHGISDIRAVEDVIKANKESFNDSVELMHRHVRPRLVLKIDSDDTAKIAKFKALFDKAINEGENIYLPKDTVEFEVLAMPSNATLNPTPWRTELRDYFYRTFGLPQIIAAGGGQSTESESKVIYLAFEQLVKAEQLEVENQIWQQLDIRLNLVFPTSLADAMKTDDQKDAGGAFNVQPNEVTAGAGR